MSASSGPPFRPFVITGVTEARKFPATPTGPQTPCPRTQLPSELDSAGEPKCWHEVGCLQCTRSCCPGREVLSAGRRNCRQLPHSTCVMGGPANENQPCCPQVRPSGCRSFTGIQTVAGSLAKGIQPSHLAEASHHRDHDFREHLPVAAGVLYPVPGTRGAAGGKQGITWGSVIDHQYW